MTPLEEKFSRKYFTNQREGFFPCSFWRQMGPLVVRWGNGSISKLIVSVTEKYFTVAAEKLFPSLLRSLFGDKWKH